MEYSEQLYHHGIKGQRWGVRRFQNEDGTLTLAGKKRMLKEYNKMKKMYLKSEGQDKIIIKKRLDKIKKTLDKNRSSKNQGYVSNANIKIHQDFLKEDLEKNKKVEKIDSIKNPSKHRKNLEKKYLAKGLDKKDAKIAADKRIKGEIIVGSVAAVAVTVLAAKAGYRYYDDNFDKTVKKGTVFQNLVQDSDVKTNVFGNKSKSIDRPFYATNSKLDNEIYKTIFARSDYNRKIVATKDLKIASKKSATKTLQDLVDSDPRMRLNLRLKLSNRSGWNDHNPKRKKLFAEALDEFNRTGKVTSKVYDAFNVMLVDHDPIMQPVTDKFYKNLMKKGYDGIKDIHDARYVPNFKSQSAKVLFSGNRKLKVKGFEEMPNRRELFNKDPKYRMKYLILSNRKSIDKTIRAGYLGVSALIPTITGLSLGKDSIDSYREREIVFDYKQEHPNTRLSNQEIVEMMTLKDKKK